MLPYRAACSAYGCISKEIVECSSSNPGQSSIVPQVQMRREGLHMLSKCLNSHCSATFRYFGQGRLSRIDFTEARRKNVLASTKISRSQHSETYPVEHFWLCENCAKTMAIELSNEGEVRVVSLERASCNSGALSIANTQSARLADQARGAAAS